MTEDAFNVGMHTLSLNFRREPEADTDDLYWLQLRDLSDKQFAAAVDVVLKTERFFPPIAVLREAAHVVEAAPKALPPVRRTEAEKEQDRARAKRWLDKIKRGMWQ